MKNILTLYDTEFEKVKKIYFFIIGLLGFLNLVVIFYELYKVLKQVEKILNVSGKMNLLNHSESLKIFESGEIICNIYNATLMIMILAIIWCLYYAFYIWYRDFYGKTKSIYTLFMLPTNKFNIYLSKLMTVTLLIYGIIITQALLWIIQMFIIKGLSGISISYMIEIININISIGSLLGMGVYPIEFIILYILTPVIVVSIIFTAIMIHKSLNKIGAMMGIIYIGLMGMAFLYSYSYNYRYSDETLIFVIGFYTLAFVISIAMSYILINKKMYI